MRLTSLIWKRGPVKFPKRALIGSEISQLRDCRDFLDFLELSESSNFLWGKMMESKKFRAHQYPLVVRVIHRTIVVISPDFNFPMPITIHLGPDEPDSNEAVVKIGRAVRLAYIQVAGLLQQKERDKVAHPTPRELKEVVPAPPKTVSLSEACRITGLKADALRGLGDHGIIKTKKTAGGHRRFYRESLEAYSTGSVNPTSPS